MLWANKRALASTLLFFLYLFSALFILSVHHTILCMRLTRFNNSLLLPIPSWINFFVCVQRFSHSEIFFNCFACYYLSLYVQIIPICWCLQTSNVMLTIVAMAYYIDLYTDKVSVCLILMLEMQFMAHHSAPFILWAAAVPSHCI